MTKAQLSKLDDTAVEEAYKAAVKASKAAHDHMVLLRNEQFGRQEIAKHKAALEDAKSKHARGGAL